VGGEVLAPLLVVLQGVEGVHVHVVAPGGHVRVGGRQVRDPAVALGVHRGRGADDEDPHVVLGGGVDDVGHVQPGPRARDGQVDVQGGGRDDEAVVVAGGEAAGGLLEPALVERLAALAGRRQVVGGHRDHVVRG